MKAHDHHCYARRGLQDLAPVLRGPHVGGALSVDGGILHYFVDRRVRKEYHPHLVGPLLGILPASIVPWAVCPTQKEALIRLLSHKVS